MVGADNPIIPLLDRRAPILERIRNGTGNDNVAQNLGELVGRVIKSNSHVQVEETRADFIEGFTESLAEELGVDEDDVNFDFVDEVTSGVVDVTEDDVLTQEAIDRLEIETEESQSQEVEEVIEDTITNEQQQSEEQDGEVSGGSEESSEGEEQGGEEEAEPESELFD